MTHRLRYLAQRIRIATAAGLVPLLLVTSMPACATRAISSRPAEGWTPPAAQRQRPGRPGRRAVPADSQPTTRPLPDWSRVEAVSVGTQTEVHLYDDEAPLGDRRVTGLFHAATADTLTLTLEEGSTPTRTLAKSAVHIVYIRRPIRERSAGWIILVGGTVALGSDFRRWWGSRIMGCVAVRRSARRSRFTSWFPLPAEATDLRGATRGHTAHHSGGCACHGWRRGPAEPGGTLGECLHTGRRRFGWVRSGASYAVPAVLTSGRF